jgi:hypothetical protein
MSRTIFFPRALATLSVLASALVAGACGNSTGPSDGDRGGDVTTPQGNGGTGDVSEGFEITNRFEDTAVYYVYAWECGATPSQTDLLGSEETIAPGEKRTFVVAPGCWEFAVVMQDGGVIEGDTQVEEGFVNEIAVVPSSNDGIIGSGDSLNETRAGVKAER